MKQPAANYITRDPDATNYMKYNLPYYIAALCQNVHKVLHAIHLQL